ncbi:hypothetical protein HYPSUDRAFT_449370 [Hypholoma sublateritium FD-334 SS-4]|uniref:Uncharacterized protein n=1 Tax=Hypholoma sublateritium (strain FD-334 SS-4) TaxID=945553 RepID=A0A0D2PZR9_HYPSF|nr:hypothetical protein HYPSUDRAFT_449370 [Hypholoma sublateritium FD-334 SS-4]
MFKRQAMAPSLDSPLSPRRVHRCTLSTHMRFAHVVPSRMGESPACTHQADNRCIVDGPLTCSTPLSAVRALRKDRRRRRQRRRLQSCSAVGGQKSSRASTPSGGGGSCAARRREVVHHVSKNLWRPSVSSWQEEPLRGATPDEVASIRGAGGVLREGGSGRGARVGGRQGGTDRRAAAGRRGARRQRGRNGSGCEGCFGRAESCRARQKRALEGRRGKKKGRNEGEREQRRGRERAEGGSCGSWWTGGSFRCES